MDFFKKLAGEVADQVVDHITKEVRNLNVGGQEERQEERPEERQEQRQEQQQRPQQPAAASRPAPAPFSGTVPKPTEEELKDLSAACQKLWDLDVNRIHVGEKIKLNLQVRLTRCAQPEPGGWAPSAPRPRSSPTPPRSQSRNRRNDAAHGKLFTAVSKDVWEPATFKIFYHLLDNYHRWAPPVSVAGRLAAAGLAGRPPVAARPRRQLLRLRPGHTQGRLHARTSHAPVRRGRLRPPRPRPLQRDGPH
jgi:hypothetical protein